MQALKATNFLLMIKAGRDDQFICLPTKILTHDIIGRQKWAKTILNNWILPLKVPSSTWICTSGKFWKMNQPKSEWLPEAFKGSTFVFGVWWDIFLRSKTKVAIGRMNRPWFTKIQEIWCWKICWTSSVFRKCQEVHYWFSM